MWVGSVRMVDEDVENPLWTREADRRRSRIEMESLNSVQMLTHVMMCVYVRPLVRLRRKVAMEFPLVAETPAGLLSFCWSVAIFENEFCYCCGSIRKRQTRDLLSGSCAAGGMSLLPRPLQNGKTVYRCQFDLSHL